MDVISCHLSTQNPPQAPSSPGVKVNSNVQARGLMSSRRLSDFSFCPARVHSTRELPGLLCSSSNTSHCPTACPHPLPLPSPRCTHSLRGSQLKCHPSIRTSIKTLYPSLLAPPTFRFSWHVVHFIHLGVFSCFSPVECKLQRGRDLCFFYSLLTPSVQNRRHSDM